MLYFGIDLHKRFLVVATEDEAGPAGHPVRFLCQDVAAIRKFFENQGRFQCVIEASSSYRAARPGYWETKQHSVGSVNAFQRVTRASRIPLTRGRRCPDGAHGPHAA